MHHHDPPGLCHSCLPLTQLHMHPSLGLSNPLSSLTGLSSMMPVSGSTSRVFAHSEYLMGFVSFRQGKEHDASSRWLHRVWVMPGGHVVSVRTVHFLHTFSPSLENSLFPHLHLHDDSSVTGILSAGGMTKAAPRGGVLHGEHPTPGAEGLGPGQATLYSFALHAWEHSSHCLSVQSTQAWVSYSDQAWQGSLQVSQ